MFLKNRALHLQVVKTGTDTPAPLINPDDVAEVCTILGFWGRRAAVGFTVVYAAKKAIDTASTISVIAASAKFNTY